MDFPALGAGLCYQFFQTAHRSTVFHAALCGEVSHADGRRWRVALEEREVEGVVSSCGDAPKKGQAIVATGVEPVAG